VRELASPSAPTGLTTYLGSQPPMGGPPYTRIKMGSKGARARRARRGEFSFSKPQDGKNGQSVINHPDPSSAVTMPPVSPSRHVRQTPGSGGYGLGVGQGPRGVWKLRTVRIECERMYVRFESHVFAQARRFGFSGGDGGIVVIVVAAAA
jgi:hypothetical protein